MVLLASSSSLAVMPTGWPAAVAFAREASARAVAGCSVDPGGGHIAPIFHSPGCWRFVSSSTAVLCAASSVRSLARAFSVTHSLGVQLWQHAQHELVEAGELLAPHLFAVFVHGHDGC